MSKRFTTEDMIKKGYNFTAGNKASRLHTVSPTTPNLHAKVGKTQPKTTSEGKDHMEWVLKALKIRYEKEYKFDKHRRFRFDFYIDYCSVRCGLEYDGIFADKSRHTSVTGFSRDQQKTNCATLNGIFVLRYSALNYKELGKDLEKLLGL